MKFGSFHIELSQSLLLIIRLFIREFMFFFLASPSKSSSSELYSSLLSVLRKSIIILYPQCLSWLTILWKTFWKFLILFWVIFYPDFFLKLSIIMCHPCPSLLAKAFYVLVHIVHTFSIYFQYSNDIKKSSPPSFCDSDIWWLTVNIILEVICPSVIVVCVCNFLKVSFRLILGKKIQIWLAHTLFSKT